LDVAIFFYQEFRTKCKKYKNEKGIFIFFIFPFFKKGKSPNFKKKFGQMFLATFYSDFRGENFLYQLFTQLPKKNNLSQIPCLSLRKFPQNRNLKKKFAYNI
jgi:hypothetical protein